MALVMNPASERFEGDTSSYGNTFDNNLREGILVDLGEAVNTGSQQATTDDDFFNELDKLKKSENDGAEEEDKKKKKDRKPRSKSGKKKQAEESQQQQEGTPDANGGYKYPSYKERRKLALVTEPAPVRSPVVPAVATSPEVDYFSHVKTRRQEDLLLAARRRKMEKERKKALGNSLKGVLGYLPFRTSHLSGLSDSRI